MDGITTSAIRSHGAVYVRIFSIKTIGQHGADIQPDGTFQASEFRHVVQRASARPSLLDQVASPSHTSYCIICNPGV